MSNPTGVSQTSTGVLGAGTQIMYAVHAGTGETFAALVEPESITPPNPKWNYVKVTNLASPAVGPGVLEEQIPSVYDPGSFSATIIFTAANEAGRLALASAFNLQTLLDFKMVLPGGGVDATSLFSGFVAEFGYEGVSADKNLTYKLTVHLTTTVTEQ
jgi:hypothetical protein